jgi:hypothetical protein
MEMKVHSRFNHQNNPSKLCPYRRRHGYKRRAVRLGEINQLLELVRPFFALYEAHSLAQRSPDSAGVALVANVPLAALAPYASRTGMTWKFATDELLKSKVQGTFISERRFLGRPA